MAYEAPAAEEKADGKAAPKKDDKKKAADFLATARKRFKIAVDASSANRKDALDDVKFYAGSPDNGWQWPENIRNKRLNDPNGARPVLTINKLPQHLRQVTNEQRQNRPSIKVIPVDDKGDIKLAEIMNGMTRHIEYISDADVAYDTSGECQVKSGEGFFRVVTDYCTEMSNDQDIFIRRIRNPFSVYMDPAIQDPAGSDAQWCFITDELDEDEFQEQFPDAEFNTAKDWSDQGIGDEYAGWYDQKKIRIAEYFCFKSEKKKLIQWQVGEEWAYSLEGEPMPEGVFKGQLPAKERMTTIKKVMWSKLTAFEPLDEREWLGKYIPVVRVVGNEEDVEGKIITSGIVRNSKDPQRMVNYWTSQEAEWLANASKAPYVGYAGQFEGYEDKWASANNVNYPFLEVNPVVDPVTGSVLPLPQRQAPPMTPNGIISAKMGAADDLKSTTGQYNPSLGQEGAAKSGIAIAREQKKGEISNFHYVDNQAKAIRHGGRIILDLIPKVYDTKRIVRIIGEDGEPDHVQIDPEQSQAVMKITDMQGALKEIYNPSIGQYDVRVTVGPSYTTKRQEAAEFMAQVLQGNKELMQVMGDLYFKMLDVPGADEIAERLKKSMPPQLVKDDDEQEQDPMIPTPQGPMPASQVPEFINQLMQQLQQAGEQLKQAGDIQAEGQQVESAKAALNTKAVELSAKEQMLGLREQLAQKTLEAEDARTEADRIKIISDMKIMVNDAVNSLEGMKQQQEQAKAGEDGAKVAIQNQQSEQKNQQVEQMQRALLEQLAQAIQLLAAPRRTVLQNDANGIPVGSVSEVVQ